MSILFRSLAPKQIGNAYKVLTIAQAKASHWFPDLKPGPYPKTPKEREEAARKYNLFPEEYEPYPEDSDDCVGDYPRLPEDSVDSKDPWYPWDNPELRKDHGEPVHKKAINLLPEARSTGPVPISHLKGTLIHIAACSLTLLFAYGLYKIKIVTPVLEEQFVTPGVTHYTFNIVKKEHE